MSEVTNIPHHRISLLLNREQIQCGRRGGYWAPTWPTPKFCTTHLVPLLTSPFFQNLSSPSSSSGTRNLSCCNLSPRGVPQSLTPLGPFPQVILGRPQPPDNSQLSPSHMIMIEP